MIRRLACTSAVLLGTVAAAPPNLPPPGASSCSGCHSPGALSLASLDAASIVTAVDAYRAGTRPATVMDRIARGFSHDEIVAIAAWLAASR